MYPEPTELLLIGCLTGLIWAQTIQIRYIDTKHQVADVLTEGNCTCDAWIIFFICSTSAISALLAALRIPA